MTKALMAGIVAILLVVGWTPSVGASHQARKGIEVKGVIISLHSASQSFLLQEQRRGQDRFWVVRLDRRTEIEVERRHRGRNDDDDDDDEDEDRDRDRRKLGGFGHLRVGDIVEVEGRRHGDYDILAAEIAVVGHIRAPFPVVIRRPVQPVPFPPAVSPIPYAPQILFPANGADIATPEFTIIGRTYPGSRVRVEVAAEFIVFQLPVTTAEVTADQNGFFVYTVRPVMRFAGARYRITATSYFQGTTLLRSTSITVNQR
jgi:hypothetical protein